MVEGLRGAFATDDAALEASEAKRRGYLAKAIEADPDDPTTLLEISRDKAIAGDLDGAAEAILRAVELAPNDADVLAAASWVAPERTRLGSASLEWAKRAASLNPLGPGWYKYGMGMSALTAGDLQLAAETLRTAPDEGFPDRWLYLAAAEALLGNDAAARAAVEGLRAQAPDFDFLWWLEDYPWNPDLRDLMIEGGRLAGLLPEGARIP